MSASDSRLTRRTFLAALGSAAFSAGPAKSGERVIAALIAKARSLPTISERITAISQALLGHAYQANTLIGGPRQPEVFVARDDRFDCVTFCEAVLAAAKAHDLPSFEAELRAIRYRNGIVEWRERNHDFAAWCEHNIANGLCQPIALGTPIELRKTITAPASLGTRSYTIEATTTASLFALKDKLRNGDIIGFVSRRPVLDYFHTGFVMFSARGHLVLRHASESHGRVVDERLNAFVGANGVRYLTLLRPRDTSA
jgi:Protein of unknown function (DUF1460)